MQNVYFEDLEMGSVHLGGECVCDKDEMREFSRRNDPWPFRVDEAAAARSPFGGVVASGGYINHAVAGRMRRTGTIRR